MIILFINYISAFCYSTNDQRLTDLLEFKKKAWQRRLQEDADILLYTTRVTSNNSMNKITEVNDEKLGPAIHINLMIMRHREGVKLVLVHHVV